MAHLIRVLEYIQENELRIFIMTAKYETGSNHIVKNIHSFKFYRVMYASLRSTSYIQRDVCNRKTVIIMCYRFLRRSSHKMFSNKTVSFLPAFYTHEDIDQSYSRTFHRLCRINVLTLIEIHKELISITKGAPGLHARGPQYIDWSCAV